MDINTTIDVNLLEPSAATAMSKYIEGIAAVTAAGKEPPPPIAIQYSLAVSAKRIADALQELTIIEANHRASRSETSEQSSPLV